MFFAKLASEKRGECVRKKDDGIKAFLGKETEFAGKLILNGSARIDSVFSGEIWGSGTLVIGKEAKVEANISVDSIHIFGDLKGELDIKKETEISETGSFIGTLKTAKLVVRDGAVFEGHCTMKVEAKNDNSDTGKI